MRRSKIQRWEENTTRACVHQPPVQEIARGETYMRGRWAQEALGNPGPITLELGCGRGEYSLALARANPARNFVGVDIKGHRFWYAAKRAEVEGLPNLAFLRARIEYIDHYFGPDEVSEIWLTFSDPQLRDGKGTKRLTSPIFLRRYARLLAPGGLVHVKTDSPALFERSRDQAHEAGYEVLIASDDVHGALVREAPEDLAELLSIQTTYEQKWIKRGRRIHYLQLRLTPDASPSHPRS